MQSLLMCCKKYHSKEKRVACKFWNLVVRTNHIENFKYSPLDMGWSPPPSWESRSRPRLWCMLGCGTEQGSISSHRHRSPGLVHFSCSAQINLQQAVESSPSPPCETELQVFWVGCSSTPCLQMAKWFELNTVFWWPNNLTPTLHLLTAKWSDLNTLSSDSQMIWPQHPVFWWPNDLTSTPCLLTAKWFDLNTPSSDSQMIWPQHPVFWWPNDLTSTPSSDGQMIWPQHPVFW